MRATLAAAILLTGLAGTADARCNSPFPRALEACLDLEESSRGTDEIIRMMELDQARKEQRQFEADLLRTMERQNRLLRETRGR